MDKSLACSIDIFVCRLRSAALVLSPSEGKEDDDDDEDTGGNDDKVITSDKDAS
jgi:hypothetical protein